MSTTSNGPEAQDSLFGQTDDNIPPTLKRATFRLQFPPFYVIVGVYRLFTDKLLFVPAWDKCKHATQRGAIVGLVWAVLTFGIQKKFIEIFLAKCVLNDTIFAVPHPAPAHRGSLGFPMMPFLDTPSHSMCTHVRLVSSRLLSRLTGTSSDAAVLLLGDQITLILRFFLSRNIRIARERAWAQTVTSRGKGPDFWQPYVEEWQVPPTIAVKSKSTRLFNKLLGGKLGMFIVKRILLLPFNFYPFVGIFVIAWLKALGTAHNLHRQYFESKKMTEHQVLVFVGERNWDYRLFGFTAALLEGLPIIGLVFTISNRIGAAMWAHGRYSYLLEWHPPPFFTTSPMFQISRNDSILLLPNS